MFEAPIYTNGMPDSENDKLSLYDRRTIIHCMIRYWNDLKDTMSDDARSMKHEKKELLTDYFTRYKSMLTKEDYKIEKHREVASNIDRLAGRIGTNFRCIALPDLYKYQIKSLHDAFTMWSKKHVAKCGVPTDVTHMLDPEHDINDILRIKNKIEEAIKNGIGKDLPNAIHATYFADEYYAIEKQRKLHEINISRSSKERTELNAVESYEILKHLIWTDEKELLLNMLCNEYNAMMNNTSDNADIIERGWLFELIQVVTFIPISNWKNWKNDTFDYTKENGNTIYFGFKSELPNNPIPMLFELAIMLDLANKIAYKKDADTVVHCIQIMLHLYYK